LLARGRLQMKGASAGWLTVALVVTAQLVFAGETGFSQKLEWDGKDDYGGAAKGGPFKVRVRAGMRAKLERIVVGDPYAYYSREMGQGDHATWCITGLDAKSDGKVSRFINSG